MNNSFGKLIEGMVAALRHNVLPATEGEFARGQAFGVIYMLESLRLRASWSPEFLQEQLFALEELRVALEVLPGDLPRPDPYDGRLASAAEMERMRNVGDGRVCELIDGLAKQPIAAAQIAVNAYLRRQLRHELATSAKPMFAEISTGRETMKP